MHTPEDLKALEHDLLQPKPGQGSGPMFKAESGRCSVCNAMRIVQADGSLGACGNLSCTNPMRDYNAEHGHPWVCDGCAGSKVGDPPHPTCGRSLNGKKCSCMRCSTSMMVVGQPRVQVVMAVVENAAGELLLAQRGNQKEFPGHWEFPGGKVTAGEDPKKALHREVHEEVGICCTVGDEIGHWDFEPPLVKRQATMTAYKVYACGAGAAAAREDQLAVSWVSKAKVLTLRLTPGTLAAMDAIGWPAGIGQSLLAKAPASLALDPREAWRTRAAAQQLKLEDLRWALIGGSQDSSGTSRWHLWVDGTKQDNGLRSPCGELWPRGYVPLDGMAATGDPPGRIAPNRLERNPGVVCSVCLDEWARLALAVAEAKVPLVLGRSDWDHYFLEIAKVVSSRATCDRKLVGAVLVHDRTIVSTGYNGAPRGLPHCLTDGHELQEVGRSPGDGDADLSCVRVVHAELNAIAQAAREGARTLGTDMYVTCSPCWPCFKVLINAGIKRVVYGTPFYRDEQKIRHYAEAASIQLVELSS